MIPAIPILMTNQQTTEDATVTEPVRCPDCGARYTYQDLVFGHAHTVEEVELAS